MGSRNRMLVLNPRSGAQNGRGSPYSQGRPSVGMSGGSMPVILEQKMQSQHMEIQGLLSENQRLAATHVALRQELAAAQQEMQRLTSMLTGVQSEKDAKIRSLLETAAKLESELRSFESVRQELVQARADCHKLHLHSQDLTQQVRTSTAELQRARLDVQQIPVLRGEMDSIRAELQRARTAFEFEKKTNAEQLEQRQAMEQNLVAVARDLEKLKAEAASAEKRSRVNSGNVVYNGGYNGIETVYGVMPHYGDGYAVQSQEGILSANGVVENDYANSLQEAAKATAGQCLSNAYHGSAGTQDPYRTSVAAEEWATHEAPNGKLFYHNLITGTTQWEKPAALETQNQVANAQALQTAANHIIASQGLSSLMNGQVQRNPIASQVLQQQQQQPTGANLIPQYQGVTQLGSNGTQIPQGPAVGQVPVGYVQAQQPGIYTNAVAQQIQMQQLVSYVQHSGMPQTQAALVHQPAGVQLQTPIAISAAGQAPQTSAPAPLPHLVHGHLSYPGAGVPTHASNGIQHPSAGSQLSHLLPVTVAQQPVLQSPQTQAHQPGPRPGGHPSSTTQQQQQQQQQLQQQQLQQQQQQQQQQPQPQQQHQQQQLQQQLQQQQQEEVQSSQGSMKPGQTVVRASAQTAVPSPSAQTQSQAQATGVQGGAKLFVFGIPEDLGDNKLADLFTPFGTVTYAKVGVEKETGRNRTYGMLVSFPSFVLIA